MITNHQAKYFANELTIQKNDGISRLSQSLFNSNVDLNPHQIDASLFALRSPLSKGAILADEVGLGKTIEAGLVMCQYWAEKKRKILVIVPASLRKQWEIELMEKFNLPSLILDSKTYKLLIDTDKYSPFDSNNIIITSYNFASIKSSEIQLIQWDLIILDEAHKLRNSYRSSNKIGQSLKSALQDKKKLLLTATPLQNSLLELFGLSSMIDENIFGDLPSFRTQYMNVGANLPDLRDRLRSFCKRTLRKDVLEYIKYTKRKLITRPFKPTEQEFKLYDSVSKYLQNKDNYAIPSGQRHLITLLVRKVLASSPHAVAGTLEMMKKRLQRMLEEAEKNRSFINRIQFDTDFSDEILDELLNDSEEFTTDVVDINDDEQIDIPKLKAEIKELEEYIRWARSIGVDTKTKALLKALEIGFSKMQEAGALQKAVVFTESVRTQQYLKNFLESNGYLGDVVTFNGSNTDVESNSIYNNWISANGDNGRSSGSKQIDIRTALIEHFRDNAKILIGTEAAAEGINLQFCSLVVNFDLPWNPQRIEQRIGRCHRYGQKYDVIVINFLNEKNYADQRVYELLNQKFSLFDGVFGASDEVIGSIESGVNFEKRILEIYQDCRTPEEIEAAFNILQTELEETINTRIEDTKKSLLEHFDADVHDRLKLNLEGAKEYLDKIGKMFWRLSKHILAENASFNDSDYSFLLTNPPLTDFIKGEYKLISKDNSNVLSEFLYRLSHPLGEYCIDLAKDIETGLEEIVFDITNHPVKMSLVQKLVGYSGWLSLQKLTVQSFEKEEYLLFSAFDDQGKHIDQETCEKIFNCRAFYNGKPILSNDIDSKLKAESERHSQATISKSLENNNKHFNEIREQLDKWAEDMELAAQKELEDTKKKIKALTREARLAVSTSEQYKFQEEIAKLEKLKRKQRQEIFNVEDEIENRRKLLIDKLEKRLLQKTEIEELFKIRWKVI